jgi:phosphoglycolate phosphatase
MQEDILLEKEKAFKAYIFDMDGTVLNTVTDLKNAMNYACEQTGHRHDFTEEDAKQFFGSGVLVAIERALALEKGADYEELLLIGKEKEKEIDQELQEEISRIRQVYDVYYPLHCNDETAPYPGIESLLKRLREAGIKTAVVSNKPDNAVQKLTELYFKDLFDYSMGERPEIRRKPAADMVNACLEALGVKREEAVYIGDSEIDMETAANSALPCISVDWGFRSKSFLKKNGAERIVSSAEEIFD